MKSYLIIVKLYEYLYTLGWFIDRNRSKLLNFSNSLLKGSLNLQTFKGQFEI